MSMKKYLLLLSVILLVFIVLDCDDGIVNDNNIIPDPLIKSDTVLILNTNTIVFTALLNTQELPFSYHYEYGDSASYEFVSEQKIIDSTNEAYIEIIDTVTNILPNAVYHYRTVINRSSGIYYSTDKVFSTSFYNPPLFLNLYADDITTIGVRLVGNINTNGNNIISYYFEYGLTKDYNNRTAEPTPPPYIINRITNLKFGEQYHYRLYLKTTRGDIWSEDKTFNTTPINNPVEFNYPFSIGTKWIYDYYLYYNSPTATTPPTEVRNGVHTWEVVSVETNNDSIICNIVSDAIDTVYRRVQLGEPPDTTYENITTYFTIVVYQYIIIPYWYNSVRYGNSDPNKIYVIPRYMEDGNVYLQLDGSLYENNIGLKNYYLNTASNTQTIIESLDFIQFQ